MPAETIELSEDLTRSSENTPGRFFPDSTREGGRYLRDSPGAIATVAIGLAFGVLPIENAGYVARPASKVFEYIYSSSVNIAPMEVPVHLGNTYTWLISDEERNCGVAASPLSVVPIQTLAPEPYELIKPLLVVLERSDDQYLASFYDANVSASGDNQEEAIINFKDILIGTFDLLSSLNEDELGPMPLRHYTILREYIRPRN